MLSSVNDICFICRLLWHGLDPWDRATWTEHGKDICAARSHYSPQKFLEFLDAHDAYLHGCLEAFADPVVKKPRWVTENHVIGNVNMYIVRRNS